VGSNFGEPRVIQSHSLQLLSILLENSPDNPSIFEVDMFGILVCLTFSLPSLFNGEGPAALPSCNIQDLHILRLLYTAHLVQLMKTVDVNNLPPLPEGVTIWSPSECLPLTDLFLSVRGSDVCAPDAQALCYHLMSESLSFLRSAALFYHFLSNVAAPSELVTDFLEPEDEFKVLTKYLALPPTPSQLTNSPFTTELVKRWVEHPCDSASQPSNYTLSVPQLITLPRDYSELINRVSDFSCRSSGGSGHEQESKIPSLCLVCGTVLCSQSYCCQQELGGVSVGACTAHSHCCGAGVGLFLRVRECKVVMFSNTAKGCFTSPPYIDQYGETDQGLRRGNPLSLCTERYTRIQRLWINHSIPEEVTNSMEAAQGFPVTDWIHL